MGINCVFLDKGSVWKKRVLRGLSRLVLLRCPVLTVLLYLYCGILTDAASLDGGAHETFEFPLEHMSAPSAHSAFETVLCALEDEIRDIS